MKEEQGGRTIHTNTFLKGAALDSDPEIVGAAPNNGKYIDGRNLRPVSNDGSTGAAQKIKGEVLNFANNTGLTNYSCIGTCSVNFKIVEIWADNLGVGPNIIRVDGVVVLKSTLLGYSTNFPLQIDKNDSGDVSEIFVTDNNIPPSIFDINDMIAALTGDPPKYFANFNPLLYQINLQNPLDIPVFVELKNVGGGGGLPVGQYQYQMRYTNDEGDLTNWSQATPMIPVVEQLSQQSNVYPWVKTHGGDPNPSSVTGFAIHLKFRVTNIFNYKYIEIKRIPYNAGAGVTFTPNGIIVAKISISPGEISVRDYFDPNESNTNIALSETDETQVLAEVESAKAIRYFDRRTILMNVKLASKDSNLQFLQINSKEGFPVLEKLYTAGHKDPYNHTYRRNWMRGEKEGFGIQLFDGIGTPGFVTKIPQLQDYQFPNRRDTISVETANYSLYGAAKAADTTVTGVSPTHEVFDLVDATAKEDISSFKNIIRSGQVTGLTGTKSKANVNIEITETEGEIENHGAHVDIVNQVSASYHPYHPVRQGDPDTTGHNYITNPAVYDQGVNSGELGYRPEGFAPNYYAMGMCVAGVTNFPKWAKAFSVVKTGSAKKVVCQGLGFYSMNPAVFNLVGNQSLATKDQNRLWFYSPDVEQGMVSSDTLNDIIDNPQNYELQFVSPLGFFSEAFTYEHFVPDGERDRLVDMITYVRMLRDIPRFGGSRINPGEDPNMGIQDVPDDQYNYVAYDKYRNTGQNPNAFAGPNLGNTTFDIATVTRVAEGRGNYLSIQTNNNFYGRASVGGTSQKQFADQGLKDWTEPVYVVNIIRLGADIVDKDVEGFKQTTHYQKLESIIGKGNALPNQKYLLVDERWEDCIPAPNATLFGASTPRFVYIKRTSGITETWVNVTFMTAAQTALIIANITSFGFDTVGGVQVTGVYTHENILDQNRFYNIVFDQVGFYPNNGDLILVRYDNTAPIRVFGGDTYLGEAIFAPIDRLADAKAKAAETQFSCGIGLPFFAYKMNCRQYVISDSASLINVIQNGIRPELGYIRQLAVMFTCETRCGNHLAYNTAYPNEFFPLTNYVIRPNRWDDKKSMQDNGIYRQYTLDYVNEIDNWQWGGFRFLPQVNSDYACEPPIKYFSRPEFGFVEKTKFHTRIMWSLPRTLEAQASPSLKTFPANNSFDIDDNQGEIKRAWDATTQRGENLYAFTNKGICLLLTKKNILSDINSNDIGYMSSDSFVKQQLWLNKDIGMIDEWWRSAAEGFVPVMQEAGTETRAEAIFFSNNESSFIFSDNVAKDIGRLDYYTKLFHEGIANVLPGYQTPVTAVYDPFHQEYWLYIGGAVNNMYVFGKNNMAYFGTFDYRFDRFVVSTIKTYGLRNLENYELNSGYVINGAPVQYELLVAASPEQAWEKEFIRLRVNSPENQKPTKIEFYKTRTGVVQCSMDPTNPNQGALYIKNYRGWEGFISRIDSSVDSKRPRLQGRICFFKIIHNLPSDFKVIDTALLYKKIKG